MKPVKNHISSVVCPKAKVCDQNYFGRGRFCSHADPNDRSEECKLSLCHGFDRVACKEVI